MHDRVAVVFVESVQASLDGPDRVERSAQVTATSTLGRYLPIVASTS